MDTRRAKTALPTWHCPGYCSVLPAHTLAQLLYKVAEHQAPHVALALPAHVHRALLSVLLRLQRPVAVGQGDAQGTVPARE